jgi:deoxyribose-phosphate aldolase
MRTAGAGAPVDQVGAEERAARFTRRSIKRETKQEGLRLAVSMCDLTTLEGQDTPGKVEQLCAKARRPDRDEPGLHVAAVCVYPNLVPVAKNALRDSGVLVASVATGFPSGQYPLDLRVRDTEAAVADGADEIDMVINRGAFLAGRLGQVADEIAAVRQACGPASLKVILETGELGSYDAVRRASWIAMEAGADFIKTSTGKVQPAATMPVTLVMLEAIRDFAWETGREVGMKPAGGIRSAKEALHYLVMVRETLGKGWMTPERFRFGASALLNDLLMQLAKERSGRYQGADYFSIE